MAATLLLGSLAACGAGGRQDDFAGEVAAGAAVTTAPRLAWWLVARYPHDAEAFTQGLLWHEGKLYESTGVYGRSALRRLDLASGRVEQSVPLSHDLFGEGLAWARGRLVQLTWREGLALLWDPVTLAPLGERAYRGEGWGLTFDGERLVQSDGTARLILRDADSLAPVGELPVSDGGRPVAALNELEAVGGVVWANVWQSDEVVRIDRQSGRVTGRLDLRPLREEALREGGAIDVLNGLAWRPESATMLVTGKLWPLLFEIAIEEPSAR